MGGGGGVRGVTDRDLESGRAGCAALADTRWRGPSARGLGAPGRPFCEDARSAQENRILGGVWGCTELDPLATPPRSPPARQTVSQPCLCPAARDRPPRGQLLRPTPAPSVRSSSASPAEPSAPQHLRVLFRAPAPAALGSSPPPPGPGTGPGSSPPAPSPQLPLVPPSNPLPAPRPPTRCSGGPCAPCCSEL